MKKRNHVITSGIDGGEAKLLGYADDMCHALSQIERLLGGCDTAIRVHMVNRGNECFVYNFISKGVSMWIKTEREWRPDIESARPFEDVQTHREDSVFH